MILRECTLQGQPNNTTIRYLLSYPRPYIYTDFSKSIYLILFYYQTHTYIYKHILRIEHFTSENSMTKYKHIHSFNINITSRYNLQFLAYLHQLWKLKSRIPFQFETFLNAPSTINRKNRGANHLFIQLPHIESQNLLNCVPKHVMSHIWSKKISLPHRSLKMHINRNKLCSFKTLVIFKLFCVCMPPVRPYITTGISVSYIVI